MAIAIIITSTYFFIFSIYTSSQTPEFIEIPTNNVSSQTEIYRNYYGVPHIIAENELNLAYAIGYAHANDRLWQMDYSRRIAQGRLSEIFGEEYLETDKLMRALAIREFAQQSLEACNPDFVKLLEAYSNGINTYLESNKKKLSFEFGALNYMPEKWTTKDCFLIAKLLAFELSNSFPVDFSMNAIANGLGVEKTLDLLPQDGKQSNKIDSSTKIKTSSCNNPKLNYDIKLALNKIGYTGNKTGSNAWAILKNKKNQSAGAILANDPHLQLTLPSKWYQLQYSIPNYNLVGLTIPGFPFILIGRNEKISWGITNLMSDDFDLFLEKNKGNDYYYRNETLVEKYTYVKDSIVIKNKETKQFYLRKNFRSYVLSDFNKSIKLFKNLHNDNSITYRWSASEKSKELELIYKINFANNKSQFDSILNEWTAPALNFTYADSEGNIGFYPSGKIPIRKGTFNNLANASWLGADWIGFTNANLIGKVINPESGFIANCNQIPKISESTFIGNLWATNSSYNRLSELLAQADEYIYRDAQQNQLDVYSDYSKEIVQSLFKTLTLNQSYLSKDELNYFYKLKQWDNFLTYNSEPAALYKLYLQNLVSEIFLDELGNDNFEEYIQHSNIVLRKVLEIMSNRNSKWIDNTKSQKIESLDDIQIYAFQKTIVKFNQLKKNTKTIVNYGTLHQLTLNHKLAKSNLLNKSLSIGSMEMSGDFTTISSNESKFTNWNNVTIGASARFIADMSNKDIYLSLPGGVSGDVTSPNFANQFQLWLRGGYLKLVLGNKPTEDFKLNVLFKRN